jgi:hypothetical protein
VENPVVSTFLFSFEKKKHVRKVTFISFFFGGSHFHIHKGHIETNTEEGAHANDTRPKVEEKRTGPQRDACSADNLRYTNKARETDEDDETHGHSQRTEQDQAKMGSLFSSETGSPAADGDSPSRVVTFRSKDRWDKHMEIVGSDASILVRRDHTAFSSF